MKNLIHSLILLLLYCAIALVACGTRKTNVEIAKNKDVQGAKITEQSNVQESASKSAKDTQIGQADKTKEGTKVTKEITYDPATGNKTGEKETTETKKSTDKSTKYRTRNFNEVKTKTKDYIRNVDTHRTITTYRKNKDVTTDRNGLYWMIGGVLGFGITVYAAYKYFTGRRV